MSRYIWELSSWPKMGWRSDDVLQPLGRVRKLQGMIFAKAAHLGFDFIAEQIENEAFATGAIENVQVDRIQLRSSIARRLGMETAGLASPDRYADGLVQVLMEATEHYADALTAERLKSWHAALFSTGYSGLLRISAGEWRSGSSPMQVVSGPPENETVHYEAPPAGKLLIEMSSFLDWFNSSAIVTDGIVKAAQTHLYFVTLHPFDDGNGRLARALTDMVLARDERSGRRLYSISSQILADRAAYYTVLEKTQKGNGDVTEWILWFLNCLEKALLTAKDSIEKAESKAVLWLCLSELSLNQRQKKVIKKLAEYGQDGFQGGLTNRNYRSIAKTSRETAKRDMASLVQAGVLRRNPGGGRSSSYSLVWPENS